MTRGSFGEPVQREGGVFAEGRRPSESDDEEQDLELGKDEELDLGQDRNPDLWSAQRPLIEEDEDDGLKLAGFDETRIPRILEAMGDDAAEAFPDAPGGTSATGSVHSPDHGGFPERD